MVGKLQCLGVFVVSGGGVCVWFCFVFVVVVGFFFNYYFYFVVVVLFLFFFSLIHLTNKRRHQMVPMMYWFSGRNLPKCHAQGKGPIKVRNTKMQERESYQHWCISHHQWPKKKKKKTVMNHRKQIVSTLLSFTPIKVLFLDFVWRVCRKILHFGKFCVDLVANQ